MRLVLYVRTCLYQVGGRSVATVLFRSTGQLDDATGKYRRFSVRLSAAVHEILDSAGNGVYHSRTACETRFGKKSITQPPIRVYIVWPQQLSSAVTYVFRKGVKYNPPQD